MDPVWCERSVTPGPYVFSPRWALDDSSGWLFVFGVCAECGSISESGLTCSIGPGLYATHHSMSLAWPEKAKGYRLEQGV